jgi:hypothetical protein
MSGAVETRPFSSKVVYDGRLFTRVHGIEKQEIASGNSFIFQFTIPYDHCKLTCVEIVEDIISVSNLEIHHSLAGKLNQFGYSVNTGKTIYKRESNYDADLFKDLIVKIEVQNSSGVSKWFGVNLVLHEVRP